MEEIVNGKESNAQVARSALQISALVVDVPMVRQTIRAVEADNLAAATRAVDAHKVALAAIQAADAHKGIATQMAATGAIALVAAVVVVNALPIIVQAEAGDNDAKAIDRAVATGKAGVDFHVAMATAKLAAFPDEMTTARAVATGKVAIHAETVVRLAASAQQADFPVAMVAAAPANAPAVVSPLAAMESEQAVANDPLVASHAAMVNEQAAANDPLVGFRGAMAAVALDVGLVVAEHAQAIAGHQAQAAPPAIVADGMGDDLPNRAPIVNDGKRVKNSRRVKPNFYAKQNSPKKQSKLRLTTSRSAITLQCAIWQA